MGIIIHITKMGIMLQKWEFSNASKNCFECYGQFNYINLKTSIDMQYHRRKMLKSLVIRKNEN